MLILILLRTEFTKLRGFVLDAVWVCHMNKHPYFILLSYVQKSCKTCSTVFYKIKMYCTKYYKLD